MGQTYGPWGWSQALPSSPVCTGKIVFSLGKGAVEMPKLGRWSARLWEDCRYPHFSG